MKTQLNKAIEALTKLRVKNVNNLPLEKQLYDVEMMLCKAVDDLEQATKTNVTDQQLYDMAEQDLDARKAKGHYELATPQADDYYYDGFVNGYKANKTPQQQLPANTEQIMKEFHKLFLDTVRQHRFIGMDTIWDFFKPYLVADNKSILEISDEQIKEMAFSTVRNFKDGMILSDYESAKLDNFEEGAKAYRKKLAELFYKGELKPLNDILEDDVLKIIELEQSHKYDTIYLFERDGSNGVYYEAKGGNVKLYISYDNLSAKSYQYLQSKNYYLHKYY